jgi:F-type H+-transporting ATPase subunit b
VIETTVRGARRLLVGMMLFVPALAFAADPHDAAPVPHGAEEVAHEAAPSLFSVEPGLMIWTIITFLVVLVILRVTAWGPMMKALHERETRIAGAIADADRLKSEAEELFSRYETMMDRAKDDARAILDEARRDGVAVQEEIRKKANEEAQDFKERARREIELAKDGAIHELWSEAANLSTELASRILGRSIDSADQERLVRELIDEMQRAPASGPERPGTERA